MTDKYTDAELDVMMDFLARGAWLIAMGSADNPKKILHKWGERSLTAFEVGEYVYHHPHAKIGLILNSAQMAIADLDNPFELNDADYAEFVKLARQNGWDRDDKGRLKNTRHLFAGHKKNEFRAWPEEDRLEMLAKFDEYAKIGPACCSEISLSKAGMHWFYRVLDAGDHHENRPNVEIFANRKPVFIQNWLALQDYWTMPPTPIQAVVEHWRPVNEMLDRRSPPPAVSPPAIVLAPDKTVQDYDYLTYLANSNYAGMGRNSYLYAWVFRASQLDDMAAVEDAKSNALMEGLPRTEVEDTARSAMRKAASQPCPQYLTAKSQAG